MLKVRESSRGIIIKNNNSVVLMHRIKKGKEYWVTPGGGIEDGETKEQALIREIKEELGNDVEVKGIKLVMRIKSKLEDILNIQNIFLCEYVGGKIGTGEGVEYKERLSNDNYYNPEIITKENLLKINIVPGVIKDLIINALGGNIDYSVIKEVEI